MLTSLSISYLPSTLPQSNLQPINMTSSNLPNIPNSIDTDQLQAMAFVAKMKEAADRVGAGFIGGFVTPDGKKFVMTNFSDQTDIDMLLPEGLK